MEENQMSEISPIRILIVDDHGMVRRGLRAYLRNRSDLDIAGEAANGQEALEMCEHLLPDVVLMDLEMPVLGGVAATRVIRHRWPYMQVIALTSSKEKELVRDALQAGAISYLMKNVSGDNLADAIQAARAGRSTLSPEALQSLIQPDAPESSLAADLTQREREVLELLVKGCSNPEIAQQLGVSRSTVKVHVSSILSKLGVASRGEAIALTIERGLLN
jgi:NarL family two-component system response regulator LiaR